MATLTKQSIKHTGLTPSFVAATGGGDDWINTGREFLYVKNGDASPMTVTVNSRVLSNYATDVDVEVSVPASSEKLIGAFPTQRFNDSTNKAAISYSAVTSVTVAVITLDEDGL